MATSTIPFEVTPGVVARRTMDLRQLHSFDSLDTLPDVSHPPHSQKPRPLLFWFGYPVDFAKLEAFVQEQSPLHPELSQDYTRSEGINHAWNRIFIIGVIRKIFGESTRLIPVYGRREGKPIIVMSFYCNFDAPERVVHESEKAFALKFTSLEGEPRWYLDWRRNPDPSDL
ncbi:hypothetical protein DEU56DRAFT_242740 [Suillus clintonianus]|uniref:uncharacterized protein n=1 Tax=Suillus clintonianus TaxID=1904413 RepID=UPI001B871B51|nr:uncharacterized protein DEU56DRAFT_242740 [Suillus clintonianus]KAG2143589.1 hypothetical protein DEU56DRAFT_242740 [Suillus clintonianus]